MSKRALAVGMVTTCILVASVTETRAQGIQTVDPERPIFVEPPVKAAGDAVVPPLRLTATRQAVLSVKEAPLEQPRSPAGVRPSSVALGSLYVSTAVLQGLDVHSTLSAVRGGAVEANPVMKGLVERPVAFIGVKAAVSYGTIMAGRSIAKKNKFAAIATLVAINSLYGVVVHHNYQVARQMR